MCWIFSAISLFGRPVIAPLLSYLGLLAISFSRHDGLQAVPVNSMMIVAWGAITLVVTVATMLQSPAVRQQRRGVGYMLVGAVAGLAVGLCGSFITSNPSVFNGLMVICTAVGVFFGFLLFSSTPRGEAVSLRNGGRFWRYLAAKGFPVAVSVMMPGLVFVLLIIKSML